MMIANPFNAQGPTDPRYYANRSDLLEAFKQCVTEVKISKGITKSTNIAVFGRWGIGKTSTLYKFRDLLRNELHDVKVFSSLVSLKPANCADADTFSVAVLENLFNDYECTSSLPEKVRNFIKNELKIIDNWKITKLLPPEMERKQKEITAITFKAALLRFWKVLKDNGFDLAIIMLDDIHYVLAHEKGELLYDLRTDIQTLSASGCRFMFVITGPAALYPDIRDKAEPFTRLFERFDLEPFNLAGTKELIEKPLRTEHIDLKISDAVMRKLHEITEGHPYFITLIMRDVLKQKKEGMLSLDEFIRMYPDIIKHFARIKFNDDFAKATDGEKKVLYKMAVSNKQEIAPNDIGGAKITKFLERLVEKDLVLKIARGRYSIYNPLFKEYLRRKKTGTL